MKIVDRWRSALLGLKNCIIRSENSYLDEEEVNAECWKTPSQFDVLVLRVNFRGSHQASVFAEDFFLDVSDFHEAERQKFLQAENKVH